MMGLVGVLIGLIIGALSLRAAWGAGLGILIFLLLKARSIYFDRRQSSMGLADLMLLLNLVIIGFLVALILRQLFAGRGRYL
jgi:hypothetical protein